MKNNISNSKVGDIQVHYLHMGEEYSSNYRSHPVSVLTCQQSRINRISPEWAAEMELPQTPTTKR